MPGLPAVRSADATLHAVWLLDGMAERVSTQLSDEERLALLATMHGLTYSDVAEHLLRSEQVVGRMVRRVHRTLSGAADREGIAEEGREARDGLGGLVRHRGRQGGQDQRA